MKKYYFLFSLLFSFSSLVMCEQTSTTIPTAPAQNYQELVVAFNQRKNQLIESCKKNGAVDFAEWLEEILQVPEKFDDTSLKKFLLKIILFPAKNFLTKVHAEDTINAIIQNQPGTSDPYLNIVKRFIKDSYNLSNEQLSEYYEKLTTKEQFYAYQQVGYWRFRITLSYSPLPETLAMWCGTLLLYVHAILNLKYRNQVSFITSGRLCCILLFIEVLVIFLVHAPRYHLYKKRMAAVRRKYLEKYQAKKHLIA